MENFPDPILAGANLWTIEIVLHELVCIGLELGITIDLRVGIVLKLGVDWHEQVIQHLFVSISRLVTVVLDKVNASFVKILRTGNTRLRDCQLSLFQDAYLFKLGLDGLEVCIAVVCSGLE